ncbi:DEAD/DEAH box helicase [Sulfurisphaera ohwakuensis]|uniref:ATP-dependent Lhr-like helicase n=1 Tax=Sulfurisphaera ohwakuensis TaxID=69656 RepID=A0A650CGZ6_SULOH|nr:DEAD/DEAH box helicase [Sulfurisphaera ohwakuensis]MBB5252516.1 ATP-dependent Lhr-like helicase [Sulfurisphaera ohwakuensis]QGR17039.1 DEAD/DEAH box helicase [Sulfurisphaera ohwakuensis]
MNNLHAKLLTLIKEKGWDELTPVQKQTLSPILEGYNTLVIAPTGYGKTEAALLPIFNLMLHENIKPVAVLYITPLKALINDITLRIEWWANKLGFIVSRKHGEVPQKEKSYRLRKAPHILVTTPEGLEIDLDWATKFREYYKNLRWVIIDEVHELINSKRGAQLSLLLERLKNFIGYDFQRIGLSATINNEEIVAKLIFGSSQRRHHIIRVSSSKSFDVKISKIPSEKDIWESAAKTILSKIERPSLLFTNSRFTTERLYEELEKMNANDIYVHHSSISKEEKIKVETSLREGKANLVICTRTLELGIHVGDIKKVFLYRPPPSVASFLQRLGRSGHAVNSVSRGEILCLYDFDILESLALYKLAKNGKIESPYIFPYLDVASREIIGLALQYDEINVDQVYEIITSSYYYRNLSRQKFDELIRYLAKREVIKIENNSIKLGKAFFKIWRFEKDNKMSWAKEFSEFFSFINTDDTFSIRFENTPVGEIDAIYVYRHLRNNDIIRISGKIWKIVNIDFNKHLINVVPVNNGEGEIPIWKGENISKSNLLTSELADVIKDLDKEKELLDKEAKLSIEKFINYYKVHNLPLPSQKIIYVEKDDDEIIYSTIISEKIANTISHMLLYLATKKYNLNVSARASIYGFSIRGIKEDLFKEILALDYKDIKKLIIKSILRSPLFFAIAKEIQYSFGKLGKLIPKEDKIIIREALKQTVSRYFSIKGTLNYISKIKEGKVRLIAIEGLTPLGKAVLTHTPIRPWISDLQLKIYQALKGGAYTLEELAELVGVSKKTLELKLKKMRKPCSKYRTLSFIDIDSGETRWCLAEDIKDIVDSGDYYNSFSPINLDETYIAVMRPLQSEGTTEIVFRVKDLVENPNYFLRKIPFNEILELRLKDPNDALIFSISPKYYYVSKTTVGFLVLNAVSYIQNKKFG